MRYLQTVDQYRRWKDNISRTIGISTDELATSADGGRNKQMNVRYQQTVESIADESPISAGISSDEQATSADRWAK